MKTPSSGKSFISTYSFCWVGGGRGERGGFWLWALIELELRRGRGGRLFEVGRLFG